MLLRHFLRPEEYELQAEVHGTVITCLIADARVRNKKAAQKRIFKAHYDKDPQHFIALSRAWKKEHPEANRQHQKNYRIRHKDDPIYKARKAKWNRDYRQRKKEKKAA